MVKVLALLELNQNLHVSLIKMIQKRDRKLTNKQWMRAWITHNQNHQVMEMSRTANKKPRRMKLLN